MLSNRRHDLVTEKAKYAGYGAPRCWVLDPHARTMLALALHEGDWQQVALVQAGAPAVLETGAGPVTVDPADLLR